MMGLSSAIDLIPTTGAIVVTEHARANRLEDALKDLGLDGEVQTDYKGGMKVHFRSAADLERLIANLKEGGIKL